MACRPFSYLARPFAGLLVCAIGLSEIQLRFLLGIFRIFGAEVTALIAARRLGQLFPFDSGLFFTQARQNSGRLLEVKIGPLHYVTPLVCLSFLDQPELHRDPVDLVAIDAKELGDCR